MPAHIVRLVKTLADELMQQGTARPAGDRAVYTVGDARHFLGVVALVNSLRLTDWTDEIVVVDCGFTDRSGDFSPRRYSSCRLRRPQRPISSRPSGRYDAPRARWP